MSVQVLAAALPPDLRYAAAPALRHPGDAQAIGDVTVRAQGCLPLREPIPAYLRYSDRSAILSADGVQSAEQLEACLAEHLRAVGEHWPEPLGAAVVVMDAVDFCFRECGLWAGNIYFAGTGALTKALGLAGDKPSQAWDPRAVSQELAALELAYLFPVARKFRSGAYDGEV